ncbi:S8 family serine peptidase [Methylovulum miyakonense]|uniref:S8 family serine peptidase n=1 Tax=Methylovulum miyakonense TaxID=645578 RepID=UPI00039B2561|nr:S8 family serine peptidase [Methylovulum miyakonense]
MLVNSICLRIVLVIIISSTSQLSSSKESTGKNHSINPLSTKFTLRVNPKWAAQVNAVLARISKPVEGIIASGETAQEYLTKRCGGYHLPNLVSSEPLPNGAGTKISFAPCIQIKNNSKIKVKKGNTLEGIVVSRGLKPDAVKKVLLNSDQKATDLQIGDIVKLPEMPLWTDISTIPESVTNRDDLISKIAEAIDCIKENEEACLLKHGVYVLDNTPASNAGNSESKLEVIEPRIDTQTNFNHSEEVFDYLNSIKMPSASVSTESWENNEVFADHDIHYRANIQIQGETATIPLVKQNVPVALEQWPYDVDLLVAILNNESRHIHTTVIGVADNGLADAKGAPILPTAFDEKIEQEPPASEPEPTERDEDENGFIDDFLGAGIVRGNELQPTGDISLCKDQNLYSSWNVESLMQASHGSIVSSIASGMGARKVNIDTNHLLPRIVFFRMLDMCSPSSNTNPADGDIVKAYEYLDTRVNIINFSYIPISSGSNTFVSIMKETLGDREKLIVLPSGNSPIDLDETSTFPASLGDIEIVGDKRTALRTLVVGAATRELIRSSYSAYGDRTVKFYAPGEATYAIDILGRDASSIEPATSFASPYAALAAGILWSFGINKIADIRDRLGAATWPLYDPTSQTEKAGTGVIDLVKVAAVRNYAIEVKEADQNGTLIRRTYVGKLTQPLNNLNLCTVPLSGTAIQAIRLGDPKPNGERELRIFPKQKNPNTRLRRAYTLQCKPEGEIKLESLLKGEKTFPISMVTQIQLPWFYI